MSINDLSFVAFATDEQVECAVAQQPGTGGVNAVDFQFYTGVSEFKSPTLTN